MRRTISCQISGIQGALYSSKRGKTSRWVVRRSLSCGSSIVKWKMFIEVKTLNRSIWRWVAQHITIQTLTPIAAVGQLSFAHSWRLLLLREETVPVHARWSEIFPKIITLTIGRLLPYLIIFSSRLLPRIVVRPICDRVQMLKGGGCRSIV